MSHPDDLSDWVLATAPRAVAYAASLLRNRQEAEDVVQDCYCRLLARADVYDLKADGLKILLRAVSNACFNRNSRRRSMFSIFGRDGRAEPVADRSAREPSGELLDAELAEAVARGLASLPDRQRAALELKSLGHSLQEIAEILGVSPGNAGVLVHRARGAMEAMLGPYLEGPPS
ncbi:RNA polymerase sigma factor [Aquisphaera insulae]|uniref:RNA polymerase sigma factor n=1 Tax=Aquisphaera insulae TaxID=2712864 RepID=UPI0013EE02CC|nr:RNA polymerase sigma factor [Aquisphaera insulae]